ncbi:MAG: hypothetical protein COB02_07235 [Candidatus Cloacimonadota bacterium]|nr:MAG: hypothetical protein COB02_07235 [Candidatus Cloacimonadota bacterium]
MILLRNFLTLLLFTSLSFAQYVSSGGYTFDVDVTNSGYRTIRNARINPYVSGTTATLEVSSDGYRRSRKRVSINSSQKHYRVRVRLDDPTIWIDAKDTNNKRIQSFIYDSQMSVFDTSKYQFEVRLSEEGFENFSEIDVDLRVNFLDPWNKRINIRGSGSNKSIKITIDRRDLREFSNNIDVVIPRDKNLKKSRSQKVQKMNFKLLQSENKVSNDLRTRILKRIQNFKNSLKK